MLPNLNKASGTWVPMGCSQEWLLVGRGRRDFPTKVCTILREGLQGRGESLLGYPSLLPPPTKKKHQHVAPISLGDGDCVGELLGGKRCRTPALASDVGGKFLVRGTWLLLSDFLVLWVSKATGLLSPPRWGSGGWSGGVVIEGLHSPPSSSTNVDEVASQGSPEDHFLFRPQDFPKQPPP